MNIVIIGGLAAGMSAAAKAKRMAKEANVIVLEGSEIISFGACGLPYFVGDFFSDENFMIARTVEQMQKAGVDVRTGHQVLSIDTEAKTIKVKNFRTEKCSSNPTTN